MQNLTEFNTAHNRRITAIGDLNEPVPIKRKRKSSHVVFSDEEEIINPGTWEQTQKWLVSVDFK